MEPDLEQLTSMVLAFDGTEWSDEDLNVILDMIFGEVVKSTQNFPSLTLLKNATRILLRLSSRPKAVDGRGALSGTDPALSWPANLRLMVRRLLQTFGVPEDYITHCFVLFSLASRYLGHQWWREDPETAVLMASLSSGRLRIVLNEPASVNTDQLVACLSLLEDFIQCVEESEVEVLDEKRATSVSKSCQEAATYLCECVIAFEEERKKSEEKAQLEGEQTESLEFGQVEYCLAVHRYLTAFLTVGGASIMDAKVLDEALPPLQRICEFCLNQRVAASDDYARTQMCLVNLVELRNETKTSGS